MNWTERLNRALDYIENNLCGDIDLKHAARLACCSLNGFSNMFLLATGIQVSEYIRRRRLSLAALELQHSNAKIIDIALKCGYECVKIEPTFFETFFKNYLTRPLRTTL